MKSTTFLYLAYFATWGIHFAYLLHLLRKMAALRKDSEELRRK